MAKKRFGFKRVFPYVVALIALVLFSVLYLYMGQVVIEKTNTRLGVEEFKITGVVIDTGSISINEKIYLEVTVNFQTTHESDSKVTINNDYVSDVRTGKDFRFTESLDKELFGENLTVVIESTDKAGLTIKEVRTISIDTPKTPTITIS